MNIDHKEYLTYARQLVGGFRSRHEQQITSWREQDLASYVTPGKRLRVLDLANGRLRPQYSLMRAAGHAVVGVDLVNRPSYSGTDLVYRVARRLYLWRSGLPASAGDPDRLITANVAALPFPDQSFDLVSSVAAFEHFLDVPAVVAETARVLCPGGLAWVCVHLFSSPSGGHNLTLTEIPMRRLPSGVEPWDHLRKRRLPFHVPLNEWRCQQYLETFAQHFEILRHYCALREGAEFLTPEIQAELADYTADELTCGAYVILARKRG